MAGIKDIIEYYKPEEETDLELKVCPFCGNKEIVYGKYHLENFPDDDPHGNRWLVFCTNCLAEIDPGWAQQRSDVQKIWNRRV